MRQYARQVDAALRPALGASGVPLILASAEPLESIYRSVNSYPFLAPQTIQGNPETATAAELAEEARARARRALRRRARRACAGCSTSAARRGARRAEITDIARAATFGAVQTLMADMDDVVSGFVDEESRRGDDRRGRRRDELRRRRRDRPQGHRRTAAGCSRCAATTSRRRHGGGDPALPGLTPPPHEHLDAVEDAGPARRRAPRRAGRRGRTRPRRVRPCSAGKRSPSTTPAQRVDVAAHRPRPGSGGEECASTSAMSITCSRT